MNPNLIEYSTKSFVLNKLQQCHVTRVNIYSYMLNIGIVMIFIIILYLALTHSRNNKLTNAERKYKAMKEQEHILSKIRFYKELQEKNKDSMYSNITDLPSMQ
jgi:sortase (surface protein transpeptidase)